MQRETRHAAAAAGAVVTRPISVSYAPKNVGAQARKRATVVPAEEPLLSGHTRARCVVLEPPDERGLRRFFFVGVCRMLLVFNKRMCAWPLSGSGRVCVCVSAQRM